VGHTEFVLSIKSHHDRWTHLLCSFSPWSRELVVNADKSGVDGKAMGRRQHGLFLLRAVAEPEIKINPRPSSGGLEQMNLNYSAATQDGEF
jgi:hypothetical protein